jgi:hypothetical protein
MQAPLIVLLAGATGHLGGLIARALLDRPDVGLRCLVRPGARGRFADLAGAGAEIVEADLDDPAALAAACAGVFTVVSALQGGPDIIVDAQARLLRAARDAGVRRFIPSDFSFDIFGLDEGDNINTDWRRAFARRADAERGDVAVIHVQNGCFLDRGVLFGFLGALDLAAGTAALWGDGAAPMDFTTHADTARYTAEAATTPETPPARFNVAGETLDFAGLLRAYAEGSGKTLTVDHRGTLADLDAEIDRRRAAAPSDALAWLPRMYWRGMLSGKGALRDTIQHRFPTIRPTTVAAYVRAAGL